MCGPERGGRTTFGYCVGQAIGTGPVVLDDMTLFSVRGMQSFPAVERESEIADRIRKIAADKSIPAASFYNSGLRGRS